MQPPNQLSPTRRTLRPFSEKKLDALFKLVGRYERESLICAEYRAYYAACVTIGAALEGALLAMCNMRVNDVEDLLASLPPGNRPRGAMDRWGMDELVMVANRLGWLPARVHPKGRLHIGDLSLLVKELRNLAHPGKHIREYPAIRLRKDHYGDARAIFDTAIDWLRHHIAKRVTKKQQLSRKPTRRLTRRKSRKT